jgi:hypothetical protein
MNASTSAGDSTRGDGGDLGVQQHDDDPQQVRGSDAVLRESWWLKGEWCDSWIYAILDRDWGACRRKA